MKIGKPLKALKKQIRQNLNNPLQRERESVNFASGGEKVRGTAALRRASVLWGLRTPIYSGKRLRIALRDMERQKNRRGLMGSADV